MRVLSDQLLLAQLMQLADPNRQPVQLIDQPLCKLDRSALVAGSQQNCQQFAVRQRLCALSKQTLTGAVRRFQVANADGISGRHALILPAFTHAAHQFQLSARL